MSLKLQKISIDVEKFNAIHSVSDECPEQLFGQRARFADLSVSTACEYDAGS